MAATIPGQAGSDQDQEAAGQEGSDAAQTASQASQTNAAAPQAPQNSANSATQQINAIKLGKDYVCAGNNVELEDAQKIECNLIVASRTMEIGAAQIAGDALLAGQEINVNGATVENNIFAAGDTVNINATTTNDVAIAANTVTLSGSQYYAHIYADTVTLSGKFRTVDISAAHVLVKSGTIVSDKLTVSSGQAPEIENGAQVNSLDFKQADNTITGNTLSEAALIFSLVFTLLGTFICGLLLLLLFRTRPFDLAAQRFCKSPARVLLTGLLTCVLVPLIAIVLLISVIGIRSMLLLVCFAFCLGLLTLPFTALALARKIFRKLKKWLGAILMLVIVGALACVPFVNIAVYIFCTLFTVGSIVVCFFDWRKSVKQSEQPENPQNGAPSNNNSVPPATPMLNNGEHHGASTSNNGEHPALLAANNISEQRPAMHESHTSKSYETSKETPAEDIVNSDEKENQNTASFERIASISQDLKQSGNNKEQNNASFLDNIIQNEESNHNDNKDKTAEQGLSQAEALLAKLAKQAEQAQQTQGVQDTASTEQQQVEQKQTRKFDRDAQVQAILTRLQEKQDNQDK